MKEKNFSQYCDWVVTLDKIVIAKVELLPWIIGWKTSLNSYVESIFGSISIVVSNE